MWRDTWKRTRTARSNSLYIAVTAWSSFYQGNHYHVRWTVLDDVKTFWGLLRFV